MTIQKRFITAALLRKYANGIQIDAYDSLQLTNNTCIELIKNGIVVAVVTDYWSQTHLEFAFEINSIIDCSLEGKYGSNLKIEVTLQPQLLNQIEVNADGKVGIYAIECADTKEIYIGQSSNIKKRFSEHINNLSIGFHHNVGLQEAWITNKKSIFNFKLIDVYPGNYQGTIEDRKWLELNEKKWIEHYNNLGLCLNRTKGEFVDTRRTLLEKEIINQEIQKAHQINDDKIKASKRKIKNKILELEKIIEIENERLKPARNKLNELKNWITENSKFFSFLESIAIKKEKALKNQEIFNLNKLLETESTKLRDAHTEMNRLNSEYRSLRTSKQKKLRVYK